MSRRSRLPKIIGVILVVMSATALGFALWVLSIRHRRWAEMEARVQELKSGLDAPPLRRVPLGRDTLLGNAWDDYLVAVPDGDAPAVEFASSQFLNGRDDG